MEKKPVSYFLVGTVLGMVSMILFLVYYFTGLVYQQSAMSWIPTLVSIALIIFFVIQYSNANSHNVTFGQLFGYGFRSTVIWTLLMVLFMVVLLYIFPDYKVKFMEQVTLRMDQQASLSDTQKDAAVKMTEKFFNISVIGGTLFVNILTGVIASLLGAAIAKKNPATPFNQPV